MYNEVRYQLLISSFKTKYRFSEVLQMNGFKLLLYRFLGKFRKTYFMALPENQQDLLRSRKLYTTGDSAAQTILQLTGGTFLVSLMTSIGISDGNMGIILSFSSLAALFQLLVMNYVQSLDKRKAFICSCHLYRIVLAFIYFIPLMPWSDTAKIIVFLVAFLSGQIFIQIPAPAATDWLASLVPSRLRSRYFTIKDSIVVFVIVSIALVVGIVYDILHKSNPNHGFVMIGLIVVILVIVAFVSFSKVNEPRLSLTNEYGMELHGTLLRKALLVHPPIPKNQSLLKEAKDILKNKPLMVAFSLNFLWVLANFTATPFNSSYIVKDLQLSFTFINVMSFAANMIRVFLMPRIGKLAAKTGAPKMLKCVLGCFALSYIFMVLQTPSSSLIFYILYQLFAALAYTYIGIGLLEIQLNFMDHEKRTIQYTILSVFTGILGFLVSTIFGQVLDFLQKLDLQIGGQKLYAQQITNTIGAAFTIIMILYLHFVVEKIKVKQNSKDGTVV